MDAQHWQRIEELFHAALELPEAEREAFVSGACKDDPGMGSEVLDMLKQDKGGVSQIGRGVAGVVDHFLAGTGNPPQFTPPERIGPYMRVEFLGKGGMGSVWKYLRVDTGQPMAIKFLSLQPADPHYEERRRRFAEEMIMLARLRHPHIVAFHDAGTLDDGTQWFVMDYVEERIPGMPFTAYCRHEGRSVEEKLRLFRSVCEAVLYAHLQGIIHRDLKPSNILIASDGTPRVVDFGIARQVRDGAEVENPTSPTSRFMSPDYAAPEWRRNGQVGVATDVYSLGVILYEVLAGNHPYKRVTGGIDFLHEGTVRELPEKPSAAANKTAVPGRGVVLSRADWRDLDRLCLKAMHSDPRERYASVESMIRDIDHYLHDEPLEAKSGMLLYRAGKFIRRNRQAVIATCAMLLLTVSLVTFFIWRLARERNIALAQAARVQHIQDFLTDVLQGGDQDAIIEHGMRQAAMYNNEPEVEADLYQALGSVIPPDLLRADNGQIKVAEQEISKSLDEIMRSQPGNKALLGNAELALGTVMIQAGDHREAVRVLGHAASDIEAANGPHSPQLARVLGSLADANMYAGNYDASDALNRRALEIDRARYGENYPHVAEDLGNLAQTQETRNNYAQAEPLEREALAIMMRWYGPSHPETARKMTTLASTLVREQKTAEATELLGQALAIQERVYGPDNPRVAYVLNSIGYVAQQQKRFDEAEQVYVRVSEIYRQAYGDADYRVAVAQGNLAGVYQAEKQYAKAVRVLEVDVQRFARALGPNDIQTGMAQVRLGRNLLFDQKYSEAAAHSLLGYNTLANQMSPDSAWVAGARHDLAVAYAKLGEPQKAAAFASTSVATK